MQMQGQQPPAESQQQNSNRDEIATLSEVRQEAEKVGQTIEQKLAARDQQYNQQLLQVAQKLKQEIATEQDGLRFSKGLNKVLSNAEFKALEVIPNLEQNLRYQVWNLQPQSIDEAVEFAEKIAKDWNSKLRTVHVAEQQKADAQKAKAKLEPSDGSAPPPKNVTKVKSYLGKDGKLNHAALRDAAMALLD